MRESGKDYSNEEITADYISKAEVGGTHPWEKGIKVLPSNYTPNKPGIQGLKGICYNKRSKEEGGEMNRKARGPGINIA